MTRAEFSHAPRREVKADPTFTALLARNVVDDPRVRELKPAGARWVLIMAALRFTDGEGKFWPKLQILAAAAGVSRGLTSDYLTRAVKLGIITRHPYARPGGKGQGSSTYRWDPPLVPGLGKPRLALEAEGIAANEGKTKIVDGEPHVMRDGRWEPVTTEPDTLSEYTESAGRSPDKVTTEPDTGKPPTSPDTGDSSLELEPREVSGGPDTRDDPVELVRRELGAEVVAVHASNHERDQVEDLTTGNVIGSHVDESELSERPGKTSVEGTLGQAGS